MGKRLIADRDLARKMKKVARFNQKKSKMDLTPFRQFGLTHNDSFPIFLTTKRELLSFSEERTNNPA